ncbi:MAG: YqjK family protein [Aquabacterium commune]|uniref:YqjK family protein n=2 Tax=Burkholderiales genera incertae sedis TaxID=224471 RepID=UPI001D6B26B3|nr:YqjK family protein [Aquabacterium sp.]MBT9609977.1 hypothetical protein [Aquabacterium sp.]
MSTPLCKPMRTRYPDLVLKKRLLRAHSALLRHQIAADWQQTVAPVQGLTDRARQGADWLRGHPALVAGLAMLGTAWLVRRPSALLSLVSKGVWLWQTWQRLRPRPGLSAS